MFHSPRKKKKNWSIFMNLTFDPFVTPKWPWMNFEMFLRCLECHKDHQRNRSIFKFWPLTYELWPLWSKPRLINCKTNVVTAYLEWTCSTDQRLRYSWFCSFDPNLSCPGMDLKWPLTPSMWHPSKPWLMTMHLCQLHLRAILHITDMNFGKYL